MAPGQGTAADAARAEHADHGEQEWTLHELATGAVILPGLGNHSREVTTSSAEAQAFFDQGLRFTYAFNHDEAARSYAYAGVLDPACAMCFWGAAYTLGPNYNMPLLPDRARAAWEAITRAQELAGDATPVERALIAALAKRYPGPDYVDPAAMQPYIEAYADAMRKVAARFPDDDDVQVLFAEAAMNVNAWKLWTPDGKPAPGTEEIMATLETVLGRSPRHPGANHYYIHTVEDGRPEKGVDAADRLGALMPGAGHLVHMPAHIYQRVGRYADASEANRRAIAADREYLERVTPPGYYPIYQAHNYGFLAYSASMEGRAAESLVAARKSAEMMPQSFVCAMPGTDFFQAEPLLVMVRFGKWEELLDEPPPDEKYAVLRALWHHAHGMALASTGRTDEARIDLNALSAIAAEVPDDVLAGLNTGRQVLELAALALQARIAEAENAPGAIATWRKAVALEDQLAYNEPADWFYPVRHYLGAALLDAGHPKKAEAVFREDLRRNPENGWALFGLWQSLLAQNQTSAARPVKSRFDTAWRRADIPLTRAAF